jgi:hypothetical protein
VDTYLEKIVKINSELALVKSLKEPIKLRIKHFLQPILTTQLFFSSSTQNKIPFGGIKEK